MGVSAACFFAAHLLKKKERPCPRVREAVYAPPGEVLQYKTHKSAVDFAPAAEYSFNSARAAVQEAAIPAYPPNKDNFVEYAKEVSKAASVGGPTQIEATDAENKEEDEKRSKFGALRFFDS